MCLVNRNQTHSKNCARLPFLNSCISTFVIPPPPPPLPLASLFFFNPSPPTRFNRYADYMVDPLPDWQDSSSSLWFNRPGFLDAPAPLLAIAYKATPPDKGAFAFLTSLLDTQMFAVFEQVNPVNRLQHIKQAISVVQLICF